MTGVRAWDVAALGPMSEAKIRELHVPEERSRISLHRHEVGARFTGLTRAATVYVLRGACRFSFDAGDFELRAGLVLDAPAGRYELSVLYADAVELVTVWKLPESIWASS